MKIRADSARGWWVTSWALVLIGVLFIAALVPPLPLSTNSGSSRGPTILSRSSSPLRSLTTGERVVSLVATVPVGPQPIWAAYSSASGETCVIATNSYSSGNPGQVTLVKNTTVVARLTVGLDPQSVVYDSVDGLFYVANLESQNVSLVNATAIVGAVNLSFPPDAEGFDPVHGLVYELDGNGTQVGVLNGTKVVGSLQAGLDPSQALFDPANGETYIANPSSSNVTVVSGGGVVGQVSTGGNPSHLDFDPTVNAIYVAIGGSNVSVIKNMSLINQISVSTNPLVGTFSVTYDPVSNLTYIVDSGTSQVSVVSNQTVLATVSVGALPLYATVDPTSGKVYVANRGSATVSILNGTSLVQTVKVGSMPWVSLWDASDHQMEVVEYGMNALGVLRTVTAFEVAFNESGLQSGTTWSVDLGSEVNSSAGATVGFLEQNGSYSFTIPNVSGYTVRPETGNVTVYGSNYSVTLTFALIPPPSEFPIQFQEVGLPGNNLWWIDFTNGTSLSSSSTAITWNEPNGTYAYTVGTGASDFAAQGGNLTVAGRPVQTTVTFQQVRFNATFVPNGLPLGDWWTVNFNGSLTSGPGSLTFSAYRAGQYHFDVFSVFNYTPTPSAGFFNLSGSNMNLTISFHAPPGSKPNQPNGTEGGGLTWENTLVLASIIVIAITAGVLLTIRYLRPPRDRDPMQSGGSSDGQAGHT